MQNFEQESINKKSNVQDEEFTSTYETVLKYAAIFTSILEIILITYAFYLSGGFGQASSTLGVFLLLLVTSGLKYFAIYSKKRTSYAFYLILLQLVILYNCLIFFLVFCVVRHYLFNK